MNNSQRQALECALIGADSLLIECGEALLRDGHRIVVVGAGSRRVAVWAASKEIPWVDTSGPVGEWGSQLTEHSYDWLFAITHLSILPASVVASARRAAINFHDGPLPEYAGLNAPVWALVNGETTYGIAWHVITDGIDEGDILSERRFELTEGETALSLNTRNFGAALDAFTEVVEMLSDGRFAPVAQSGGIRTTYSKHDRLPAMAIVDWSGSAETIQRVVRAVDFGPYPNPVGLVKVMGPTGLIHVLGAEVLERDGTQEVGTVLAVGDDGIAVSCAVGALLLTRMARPTGELLAPIDAAADLGVRVGDVLPAVDPELADELTELGTRLSRAEAHHLRELESFEPVELPWASTPAAGHVADHGVAELATTADESAIIAAFSVLLARLSGKQRLSLALADAATSASGLAASAPGALVPLVAPVVPISVEVPDERPLDDLVSAVSTVLGGARRRGPMAGDLIARRPALASSMSSGVPMRVLVNLGETSIAPDGVVLELRRDGGSWSIRYDRGLVSERAVRMLIDGVGAVLRSLEVSSALTTVAAVDILGPEQRAQVLEQWNDTAVDWRSDVCIHRLFEEQVDRAPERTALVFEDVTITYGQLDRRANQLAHHLISLGVGADELVGVRVTRGIDLVVAVLGVLKAGAAYVPLDPMYPAARLEHMVRDSGCAVVVTESAVSGPVLELGIDGLSIVELDADREAIDARPDARPEQAVVSSNLAYCIYTSGSTGVPKGVLIEHRNAVNFFAGMDPVVPQGGTWFAVTSLSFDISVLELLYTACRGFTVVIHLDRERSMDSAPAPRRARRGSRPVDFSLFYFSGDEALDVGAEKYRLLLDGARWADENGFTAVWTPERHFHAFGGLYPQPAVTSAAVAAVTQRIGIRAGSVVMPLNHPIRVAEEWSVVDNISDGRVGISFASGWQPNDFVLRPETFADAKAAMFDGVDTVRRLWRGETVSFEGPQGAVDVVTLPRPKQPELPVWVTTAGNVETFRQAGLIGANLLTHLLGQTVDQLAPKIDAYRRARAEGGHDPDAGIVTLMLHTFVGDDEEAVRAQVREPLKQYLATSFSLLREHAWSFPAFRRPGVATAEDLVDDDFKHLEGEELDAVLEFAFLRYYESSGLFGTPQRCAALVSDVAAIGVDEVACLIDFGVPTDVVLDNLHHLAGLRDTANSAHHGSLEAETSLDQSVAAQLVRHGVTHLQCTPSLARMMLMDEDTRRAMAGVRNYFIGGEAFPVSLAHELVGLSPDVHVTNMYGPTETTIWSTTWKLEAVADSIPIGAPIANTQVYVLDRNLQPMPAGVPGELWIGGDGVARGYHRRPELTAERFLANPFRPGERMYRTGDLARWQAAEDGSAVVEFLGRTDFQVKIRGYRIELGEIETALGRSPGVLEAAVAVRQASSGEPELVGYVSPQHGVTIDPAELKGALRAKLPDVMVPAHVVVLDDLPHTPNGKIDRNALPAVEPGRTPRVSTGPTVGAGSDLERQVLGIWETTLGTSGIGIDDNFFDIGGHSLLIVQMHRRLREVLAEPVALTDLYRFPTVRSFAASRNPEAVSRASQVGRDRAAKRRGTMRRRVDA